MRNMTPAELETLNSQLASARSISDVTRIARVVGGYRISRPEARPEIPSDYTATERAWFRRALGSLALVLALACGGTAYADRPVSPDVATAKAELATARAHMKAAREADKRAHASERAARKEARKVAKIAKLKAALAKAEGK